MISVSEPPTSPPPVGELSTLFRAQRPGLVRLAHLIAGSSERGEELVQEAFLAAQLKWATIENPAAYVRVAVINLARSSQRRQILERRHAPTTVEPVTGLPDLDETWHVLRRLPVDQRAAIVLRFYDDLSLSEIAAAMDRPVNTVKSLIHRGLGRLKEQLR